MAHRLHSLVTFRGRMGATGARIETWSTSLRIGDPIAPVAGLSSQDRCDAINDLFATFFTDGGTKFLNTCTFEETRMYDIGTDNRATIAPFMNLHEAEFGANGSNRHPFQCSLVGTFVAGGLGPGRRGRMFLPPQGLYLDDAGELADGDSDAIAFALAGMLTSINSELAGDAICVISSGKGAGVLKPIDSVRVGKVIDTHRSRRRSLPERYSESAVAVSP